MILHRRWCIKQIVRRFCLYSVHLKEKAIMKLQWVLGSITLLSIGYYSVTANEAQTGNILQNDFCFDGNNEGHRLNATVLKLYHVQSYLECILHCLNESCCRSVNYRKGCSNSVRMKNCELLHNQAWEIPNKLVKDASVNNYLLLRPNRPFECNCTTWKKEMISSKENKNCSCPSVVEGKCGKVPKGCDEWFGRGFSDDGVYTVDPDGKGSFKVRCDMKEKIWTVFQRRMGGTVDFNRSWSSYENGFGDPEREFWLGLDKIHRLTHDKQCSLRVDLWDFHGNNGYALYESFSIKNETDFYRLKVSDFSGSAGDSLTYHNRMRFSTHDKDNDLDNRNCAREFGGGWWFNKCVSSNLNGLKYMISKTNNQGEGISWKTWNDWRNQKRAEMKLSFS